MKTFQANIGPAEDRMIRQLKAELDTTSNEGLLSEALKLLCWVVAERKRGNRILSVPPDEPIREVEVTWVEPEKKDPPPPLKGRLRLIRK